MKLNLCFFLFAESVSYKRTHSPLLVVRHPRCVPSVVLVSRLKKTQITKQIIRNPSILDGNNQTFQTQVYL